MKKNFITILLLIFAQVAWGQTGGNIWNALIVWSPIQGVRKRNCSIMDKIRWLRFFCIPWGQMDG